MGLQDIRITASWYPPTAEGVLFATDTPREHIGGIVTMGRGGFTTTVGIDEPTRFTISADGHDPFTFTLDPSMTGATISEGTRMPHFPASFEVAFHYPAEAREKTPMNSRSFIPPRAMVFARPSGDLTGTIPMNEHAAPSPQVREFQRLLLGTGFTTGAQGADGILGINTARSIEAFARWYNSLPERPMADPMDLSRGPIVAVDRALTPEKQTALRRFAARASDQLSSLQQTVVERPAPPAQPAPTSMLAVAGAVTGVVALVAFVAYANARSNKRRAAQA